MHTFGPTECCEHGQNCKQVIPVVINKVVIKTVTVPGFPPVTAADTAIVNGNVHVEPPVGFKSEVRVYQTTVTTFTCPVMLVLLDHTSLGAYI